MLSKSFINISSVTVQNVFKDFLFILVHFMFEELLWLIFALAVDCFLPESLKACADFSQHALMADSSLMETHYLSYMYLNEVSLDTCMYHKPSTTAVTTAHVSSWLRSFLYHVLLVRALHHFIDKCDQRVWFRHLWSRTKFEVVKMNRFVLISDASSTCRETKCILEFDFRACIGEHGVVVLYLKVAQIQCTMTCLINTIATYETAECYGLIRIKYSK